MVGDGNAESFAFPVDYGQRFVALCGARRRNNNEIVEIMSDQRDTLLVQVPSKGVGNRVKNLRRGPQPEREHRVHIHLVLPLNAKEGSVVWMNRDQAVGRFDVHFRKKGRRAKLGHEIGNLIDGGVCEGAKAWVHTVIDAMTMRER